MRQKTFSKKLTATFLAALLGLLVLYGQQASAAAQANPAVSLSQCANGKNAETPQCDWQNGNLNESNSNWKSGDYVPYRYVITGLTAGNEYCLGTSWDLHEGNPELPALDWIGTYRNTLAAADPTQGTRFAGSGGTPASQIAIPNDPALSGEINDGLYHFVGQAPSDEQRMLSLWGGTFTFAGNYAIPETAVLDNYKQNSIEFCFVAASTEAVVSWAGHIADPPDWLATAIPTGSPFHMRTGTANETYGGTVSAPRSNDNAISSKTPEGVFTNHNLGNMDRSLKATAVNSVLRDWGDLPDSYRTSNGANGANHILIDNLASLAGGTEQAMATAVNEINSHSAVKLGELVTGDPFGPTDGTSAEDTDDGIAVTPNSNWSSGLGHIDVTTPVAGCLNVWLDYIDDSSGTAVVNPAGDGDFDDVFSDETGTYSEHVLLNHVTQAGMETVSFALPHGAGNNGYLHLRARITPLKDGLCDDSAYASGAPNYFGTAVGGEVEDYLFDQFGPTAITLGHFGLAGGEHAPGMAIVGFFLVLGALTILVTQRDNGRVR